MVLTMGITQTDESNSFKTLLELFTHALIKYFVLGFCFHYKGYLFEI